MGVGVLTHVGKMLVCFGLNRAAANKLQQGRCRPAFYSKQQYVRAHAPVCAYAYVVSADVCASPAKLTKGDGGGEAAATAK